MPWPHAPVHWTFTPGIYMVTAGTLSKVRLLGTPERLSMVHDTLHSVASEFDWRLNAWAVLSNHYHFVAQSPDNPRTLGKFLAKVHAVTARELNRLDGTPGRKVWFQHWDSHITFEASYLARLRYVHTNPVHHGITDDARNYRWCSAGWFEANASHAFRETLERVKIDSVNVVDDF